MLNELKSSIRFFIEYYGWIDFVSYFWLFLVFIFLFCISIYIISRFQVIGILILIFSILGSAFGVFYISEFLDKNLRNRTLHVISQKQLTYSDTLMVNLQLTNLSKKTFVYCRIKLKFYTPSSNFIKNRVNMLKPFLKETIVIKDRIDVNDTKDINAMVNNFRFQDFSLMTSSECF